MSVSARGVVVGYLLLLQFLYSWAWSSSDVLRPTFRRLYGLSLAGSGSAYSAQVAGALVGALLVGRVEHQIGRRLTLAVIAVGCGGAFAAGAVVSGLPTLIAQRAVLGVFMGGVFPVTVGILVDLFRTNQRGKLASLVDATYFSAVMALGWAAAGVADLDWQLLFWPVGATFCALGVGARLIALPPHAADRPDRPARAIALFSKPLRRRTLVLLAMISVNACAHQAFVGWLTVYLIEIDGVSREAVAATLSAQAVGSISGCFAWGWTIDRYGRRAGGRGLMAAGLFALAFVALPGPLIAKQAAAFGFGFAFASVATLGPWLAELYPPGLRAPATAIFQWGRCVSLLVPPATGLIAVQIGLPAVMALAGGGFVVAGIIWRSLPETHVRRSTK